MRALSVVCHQLATLLPTDENFLDLFRRDQGVPSSVQFMRVWRLFDKDSNGYIDVEELAVRRDAILRFDVVLRREVVLRRHEC